MNGAAPATAEPKRWPIALLVALITGIASSAVALPVAEVVMKALHVSNFEGARDFGAACLWAPLAGLIGCAVGFIVSFQVKRPGFAGYAIRQGLALLIMAALIGGCGGLVYAAADHPPLIDGKNLALEIEMRVPGKGRSIEDLRKADFGVALVVSASDRNYSEMRWTEATQSNEFITVPAWALLNSRNASREITAGVQGESRQIFNVMLMASPKIDNSWSEWAPPRERFDHTKPEPNEQYFVRYRVRSADEYSPTPSPTMESQPAPSPEESPSPNESSIP